MKVDEIVEDIDIIGGKGKVQAFDFEFNAKAFDILSSKLYKYKISAIIRELSSNAYDSHVEANNKDLPFEIHVPNKLFY